MPARPAPRGGRGQGQSPGLPPQRLRNRHQKRPATRLGKGRPPDLPQRFRNRHGGKSPALPQRKGEVLPTQLGGTGPPPDLPQSLIPPPRASRPVIRGAGPAGATGLSLVTHLGRARPRAPDTKFKTKQTASGSIASRVPYLSSRTRRRPRAPGTSRAPPHGTGREHFHGRLGPHMDGWGGRGRRRSRAPASRPAKPAAFVFPASVDCPRRRACVRALPASRPAKRRRAGTDLPARAWQAIATESTAGFRLLLVSVSFHAPPRGEGGRGPTSPPPHPSAGAASRARGRAACVRACAALGAVRVSACRRGVFAC